MQRLSFSYRIAILILVLLPGLSLNAQITTTQISANDAVQNVLIGTGVIVNNIQSFGTMPVQIGEFNNGLSSGIGIERGVVLTSGFVNPTAGPMSSTSFTFASDVPNAPGDQDLNTISGFLTNDAAILQFDFVPTGDTIKFRYVFASEEYPEFVNSGFNDVFAFLLSGPNPMGGNYVSENIALIPGTTTPVSINNVNGGLNSTYYVDNTGGTNFIFDGYTTVLTAIAPVVPCVSYTIKLAIADAGDFGYDSGVFLEAGSFTSNIVNISSEVDYGTSDTILYEGCSQASIFFVRAGSTTFADTISFFISGSATMGSDYNTFPSSIIFAPGQDTVILTITPFLDQVYDPGETITLTYLDTICGEPFMSQVTLVITDIGALSVNVMPDTNICAGASVPLIVMPSGGAGFYDINWTWSSGSGSDPVVVTPLGNDLYIVSVYDDCIDTTAFDTVRINVYPVPQLNLPDLSTCSGVPVILGPQGGFPGFNFTWNPGSNLDDASTTNPVFTGINQGSAFDIYIIGFSVDSAGVSCLSDSTIIIVFPEPALNLEPDTLVFCEDASVLIDAGPDYVFYNWSTGANTPSVSVGEEGTYTVMIIDSNGCQKSDSITLVKDFKPVFTVNSQEICTGDTALLMVPDSLGSILWSTQETTPGIMVMEQGEYLVSISNSCGSNTDTAFVTIKPSLENLELPNTFSPNGDGINDTYMIPALVETESFRMDFYNRWGIRIFSTTDMNSPWTGTNDAGAPLTSGTYFVIVSYLNCNGEGEELNGSIFVVTEPQ